MKTFTNSSDFYKNLPKDAVEVSRQSFGCQTGWRIEYEDAPRSFDHKSKFFAMCEDGKEFYGEIHES